MSLWQCTSVETWVGTVITKIKMCTINSVHARYKTKGSLYTLNNCVLFLQHYPLSEFYIL